MSARNLIITLEEKNARIAFSGDTYSYREEIKSCHGAKWQFDTKTWAISSSGNSVSSLKKRFPLATYVGFNDDESAEDVVESLVPNISNEPSDSLSVSSLIFSIDAVLRKYFSIEQKVFGIIKNVKSYRGTRIYFDLHDPEKSDVAIRCVIWENQLNSILALEEQGFKLEDDLPVLLSATIAVNSKNANCSLQVKRFYPEYTKGKIAAERDKTNNRLKSEGLFNLNKQLTVTSIPKNLAVLTSKTGTVINDFLSSLSTANFGFNVSWYPIRVQGSDARSDVIKAIQFFNEDPEIDIILLFRGGGSSSDLSVFNAYEVAKAICLSKKPIFSAVGHEEDQSSAQDVSNKSFGVPKDIGHYLSRIIVDYRDAVLSLADKILIISTNYISEIESKTVNIVSLLRNISRYSVEKISNKLKSVSMLSNLGQLVVKNKEQDADNYLKRLFTSSEYLLNNSNEKLINVVSNFKITEIILKNTEQGIERFQHFFKAISPEVQLSRGFAIIRHKGKILTSGEDINSGDRIQVSLKNIELETIVENIKQKEGEYDES